MPPATIYGQRDGRVEHGSVAIDPVHAVIAALAGVVVTELGVERAQLELEPTRQFDGLVPQGKLRQAPVGFAHLPVDRLILLHQQRPTPARGILIIQHPLLHEMGSGGKLDAVAQIVEIVFVADTVEIQPIGPFRAEALLVLK